MNTYLAIMVTVLVATQIVRVTQNAISLWRQEHEIKKHIGWIEDNDVSEHDFEVQRNCFYLLQQYLEKELNIDYGAELEDYYEGNEET